MIFTSIRWRVQIWHGLILVIVLAGFGFTAYHVALDNQMRRIDQELQQRSMFLFRPGLGPMGRPPGGPGDRGPGGQGEGRRRGPIEGGPPFGGERPPGTPGEGRHRFFDPAEFKLRMQEAVEKAASVDAGQTNAFYYVLWQEDGSLVAKSTNAPPNVPAPDRFQPIASPNVKTEPAGAPGQPPFGPPMSLPARTRGEWREAFRPMPGGILLVGRSIASDMAAMRRLAWWLTAAGTGVLLFGLAGGWWLAARAIRPIEDISATAMKIAAGDLTQRINAADTDSELGRLASVLNSTFARLEAAFAHQARFTSDASHELRTPVSVILTQTQTALNREREPAEYRHALEACQRAAQRMRRLTELLLELARLDAGQEPMKREPFDLARVARDCVELVRPLAAERGIELRCELPPTQCLGDAERISQVATNLLSNAIHYNREHGEVRISTHAENGTALLTVADTGEGIPADDLPHIFERFYRVDQSRSGRQGRTGLGLAISKAIVDAHSGTLEVASQPGTGSTFTLKLPTN